MPAADAAFVSLADLLRGRPQSSRIPLPEVAASTTPPAIEPAPPASTEAPLAAAELPAPFGVIGRATAIREARLFRAALGDAFEVLVADLARRLAQEVLARELHYEPTDMQALARRLIAERCDQEPLRLRVAPADADVACDLPVVADPTLAPGDAILECSLGDIDARLGVRLAEVLATVEW